jgi:hypothetical protein
MLDDLIYAVNELVNNRLIECRDYRASDLGLDERCGVVSVSQDFIAVPIHSNQRVRYYGGFEYVCADHVVTLGEWVFYSAEDARVREHLSRVYPEYQDEEMSDE